MSRLTISKKYLESSLSLALLVLVLVRWQDISLIDILWPRLYADETSLSEYVRGSKVIISEGKDASGQPLPAYPYMLGDPAKLCDDVIYYDASGNLNKGLLDCSGPIIPPTLIPENIKAGVVFGNSQGTLLNRPDDCATDGSVGCVSKALYRSADTSDAAAKIVQGQVLAGITGTAAPLGTNLCSSHRELNCVANSTFKAADLSLLTPDNIKAGVTLAGVTGRYPSLAAPLSGATATQDLLSFGPTTAVGSYEFFDSTGTRYQGTIGDGGLLTATLASQSLNAANTFYRQVQIAGDPDLISARIKLGITLFGVTGTLSGAPANCTTDGEGSCLIDGSNFGAALLVGAAAKIMSGQTLAGITGNVTAPDLTEVLSGVSFGAGGTALTGSLTLPSPSQVRVGNGAYGVGGTGSTPTLGNCSSDGAIGCVVINTSYAAAIVGSAASKILSGQSVAGVTGNVTLPPVNRVLSGSTYGVGGNGLTGTLTLPAAASVLTGSGTYGDASALRTPTYSPDYPAVAQVRSNDTVDGVTGQLADCTANNEANCYTNASSSYKAANLTNLSAFNIKSGVVLAGVTGSLVEAPSACGSPGAQSCTVSGSYFAGTACSANGSACYLPAYTLTSQPLKAISYDAIDTGKASIRSSLTLGGVVGTLADCTSNNQASCFANSSSTFKAGDLTNLSASNIRTGVTIAGVTGSVVETPANCSSPGTQSCVASGTYYAATNCASLGSNCFVPTYTVSSQPLKAISFDAIDTGKTSVRSTVTLAGIAGTLANCSANQEHSCVPDSTTVFRAADLTNLATGNIKSTVVIAGVTGTVVPAPANCASGGSQSCVATGSYYAATACAAQGSQCYVPSYVLTSQPLKAIDVDAIESGKAKIRSTLTLGGIAGTAADCAANSAADCFVNSASSYLAANLTNLSAGNIRDTVVIAGVTGSVVESPAACGSNGAQSCRVTGSYYAGAACADNSSSCFLPSYVNSSQSLKAIDYDAIDTSRMLSSQSIGGKTGTISSRGSWDLTTTFPGAGYYTGVSNAPTAGLIKGGVTILGVTGDYPSATYPLASATGTTDLTSFSAQIKTDGAFEFFDSSGNRYTGSGDSDLVAAKIKSGVVFENLSLTGTLGGTPDPWDLRVGVVVNGVTGALKVNCRNRGNTAIYNSDASPPGTAVTTAGSVLNWWDTIEDSNNGGAFTPSLIAGWDSTTDCAKDAWQDLSADGACNSAADDCIFKDRITGLMHSESYPVTGIAPATTSNTINWSDAVAMCNNLVFGTFSDWRLPTQKELQESTNHGLRNVAYTPGAGGARPGGDTLSNNDFFIDLIDEAYWSATTSTSATASAVKFSMDHSTSTDNAKTNLLRVICVR